MKNEIEQGLHEKLCAFILGEADEGTRAEVERALETSHELREERERLEKTIGLVKETMSGAEALPLSAVAQVLSAASRPRSRRWYALPSVRLAAGIGVVALGSAIYCVREMGRQNAAYAPLSTDSREGGANENARGAVADSAAASTPDASSLLAMMDKKVAGEPAPVTGAATAPVMVNGDAGSRYVLKGPGDNFIVGLEHQKPLPPGVTVETLEQLDALRRADEAQSNLRIATVVTPPAEQPVVSPFIAGQEPSAPSDGTAIGVGSGRQDSSGATAQVQGVSGRFAARPSSGGGPSSPASTGPSTGGLSPELLAAQRLSKPVGFGDEWGAHGEKSKERLAGLGYVGEEERRSHNDDFFLGRGSAGKGDHDVAGKDLSLIDQLRAMTPAERDQYIEFQCKQIVTGCYRRPNERPRDMFFRFYGDNPFELAGLDRLSTFSVDVDTASYALARRYLKEGNIPEKAQIRTEEFVNYFKADVPAPTKATFAIHTDLTPSRFGGQDAQRWMLRVVIRGREVQKAERKPLNLTFVVDTSGSMREQNRLELVKHAMRLLVNELDQRDSIAIVAFSSDARQILPMTSARQKAVIESAIFPLQPEGSTNAAAGVTMGYEIALASLGSESNNRVVLLSDGVANTGQTDQDHITADVKRCRERGIYLNTIGVGMNNHNDELLEQLADKGDGVCNYVDTPAEARRVIVDGFTGAFETIARDVKVQVEFDPTQVHRYRLLGYENRAIADQDFRNDKIDAGEVGAGHQVTALYEIERTGNAGEKPLAVVRLRWKAPRNVNAPQANEEASEIEKPVLAGQQTSFEGAGVGYRRAAIVAQFAEILRRSVHARGDSLDDAIVEGDKLRKEIQDPEFDELVVLMHQCKQLILQALPACDDLCQAIDAVRRNQMLRCERELLAQEQDAGWIAKLEQENAELERRIKDLIRLRIEQPGKAK